MALYEEFEPRPNRLIDAHSAYLRNAAYQPVGWYPYGPEAFAEAQRQDKLILLDIGASWCHWCHVIDRESYEDPEIATLLNERYIAIKVDRDERPDIDARYQTAVQLLTGGGGWPLTVFLTPDGTPFYGGTYFPPRDFGGRLGLATVLPRLADIYRLHRDELQEMARLVAGRTAHAYAREGEHGTLEEATFHRIANGIRIHFDPDRGGFERTGPKFPHAGAIELALLQWDVTGDQGWRNVAHRTLTAMAQGGIYDHLGGGFHRYANDADWRVPHFEKMGYDNALLLACYTHAYRAFGDALFREVATETLDCLLHDFADWERGGFYGTQDADNTPRDDGSFWTWSLDEFTRVLNQAELPVLVRYFGVRRRGDMPESGRNVLHVAARPESIAEELGISLEDVHQRIASGKRKLLAVRHRRKIPPVDTTKYLGWNALLISACLEAGTLLGRDNAVAFALRTVEQVLRDAYDPDRGVYHLQHPGQGVEVPGLFEDQAYMARALLDAFSVNGDQALVRAAQRILDLCIERYWDEEHDGFLDVERMAEAVPVTPFLSQRRKVIEDTPTPAANAVAVLALDRLALLTGDARYHEYARRTLVTFAGRAPDYGPFAATYGLAMWFHLHPPAVATIVGPLDHAETRQLWTAALETYRPGRLVAVFPPDAPNLPCPPVAEGAIACVCAGQACAKPTAKPETLRDILRTFGRNDGTGG